ncbi:gliding motility-associated C-terminal domain-containing protein [Lewinella sp. JB7]|uniref:T9SS type B sorting domain-containing protein n=1 Tax=Lewinella sp. JB7 TaxID=2962887 RepID=UPI0020C9AC15|nr:gliding motility-associated C-terminal domain-containing protein [Lewinella sp. JB7]MCP9237456.1 gliding motility-associated C-terminal domain-containing protein [Lewinella sp. JB7]
MTGSVGLRAQEVEWYPLSQGNVISKPAGFAKAACTSVPGTLDGFTNINVTSNSFAGVAPGGSMAFASRPDTIFLCMEDELGITHVDNSEDLSGDPNPATQPGVGYGVYTCPPTVTGPFSDDINNDPCNPDLGTAAYNGDLAIAPPVDYFGRDYDLTLRNRTIGTTTLFGGPVVLYFAPMTVDSFDYDAANPGNSEFRFEGTTTGTDPTQCTVVDVDQTFAVGFLNAISVSNATQSGSDCSGSFRIGGGVSELRGTGDYTISVRNTATNQTATLDRASGAYRHGDQVNYTVPTPGDYEITIADGVSCDFAGMTINHSTACVTTGTASLDFTAVVDSVSCPGEDDGSITITATGGVAPYSVTYRRTIPPPATTGPTQTILIDGEETIFTDLVAGFYNVTVTDALNETVTREVQVVEGVSFGASIQVVQRPLCNGDDNGVLVVSISENAAPVDDPVNQGYRIQWSTGAIDTDTIDNLSDGPYSVTVTDIASGCTRSSSVTLDQPNALFIDVSQTTTSDATCSGSEDGAIRVRVSGGVRDNGNYNFTWSDGFTESAPQSNRTNLNPGDYGITVTDFNGCSNSRTFSVAAAKILVIATDSTNVSCFGDTDGRVTVGGSATGSPATLPFRAGLLNEDGTTARAFSNIPPGNASRVSFENLAPGTYIAVLRDSDPQGCEVQERVTISEPDLLEIDEVATTDVGCPDQAGTATVNVSGGTAPYTFRFVNDSIPSPTDTTMTFDSTTLSNLNNIGDLQPDTNYIVIVTDANGCVDTSSFQIFSPPTAIIQPIATDFVSCPGDSDGQLTVVASPPPGDSITITGYTWYRLNPDNTLGEQVDIGRTTSADLTVGAYVVEIALSNECTSYGFGEVASPGLVELESFTVIDPTCLGDNNGSIFVTPRGGTPNADGTYNYLWSNNGSGNPTRTNNINNLTAGTYSVTISDANACQPFFDTTFVINDPVGITGDFAIDDVSCPDETTADGSATFSARLSDGTAGTFDFFWSTGDTIRNQASSTLNNLTRGPISVTVTDGNCPQVFTDTIGSPENFTFDQQIEDASCNGQANGAATVSVSGGTPGYTFDWVDRTETGNAITDVKAGIYPLVITDANGCSPDTLQVVVGQPDPLVLEVDPLLTTPRVTCAGDEDGTLAVYLSSTNNNPLGDNPYSWSANVADNDDEVANNLAPGTYGVTVTDTEGCQDSVQYTILEPSPIFFTVEDILPPLCFGETTTISIDTAFGGQSSDLGDFTFTLNDDGFLFPADQPGTTFAGEVLVTVFDSVGCTATDSFSVQQPPEIVIDLPERITVELGDSLRQLTPLISPATDTYTYQWTPADFLSSDTIRDPFIFPLQSRDYTLTVTNQNGCQSLADIYVEVDANRNIYIPNAFSPNQDGRNDDFRIYACRGVVGITQLNIFNRWGGLVHELTNIPANCLDGTVLWDGMAADGKRVDPGVFVYTVEVLFLDGVRLLYRGDIAVVR